MPLMVTQLAVMIILPACLPWAESPALLGQNHDAKAPWWNGETALDSKGGLDLTAKPWWPRAAALESGQSFIEGDVSLVRRETFEDARGKLQDAIVWVIDDDNDNSLQDGGDRDSDCYVVDYDRDGSVDRMLDYIDDDGDNDPDEMDIRYFVDGQLRYCWSGIDYDDDNAMWSLRGYEYGGPSFFESDPHGDNMIYMNKLDTDSGTWSPISECPFAFYDTDHDGFSEIAIRCSAVPLTYDPNADPDYANDYGNFAAPWNNALSRMGIVNLRYSFDIDGRSSAATPLHYDFGFNLVGELPYEFPGMHHHNPLRRSPQVTIVTPFKDLRTISDNYPARETGFSWMEERDDTISNGYGEKANDDLRWEGVFWTWERRFMENTGGPNQKWNVRREYSDVQSNERVLYYSAIDRRIHLKGAREGWIQVGHFNGLGELGEIRMFDTDANGYFDRWEYDFGRCRVVQVRDERVEDLAWNPDAISERYTNEILPRAIEANRLLLDAMSAVLPYAPDAKLAEAAQDPGDSWQRYAQDVLRELQYAAFVKHWNAQVQQVLRSLPMDDLRPLSASARNAGATSKTAWELRRMLTDVDSLYSLGSYEAAAECIRSAEALFRIFGNLQAGSE